MQPDNGERADRVVGVVLAQEAPTAAAVEVVAQAQEVTATNDVTGTEGVTATDEATATDEVTVTNEVTGTDEVTASAEATQTQESSGEQEARQAAGIPTDRAAVLTPGEPLPVDASIQLVKVAEGFVDPVNVVSPQDGSGRLFVIERHGVVRIVNADGQILEEPFLDIQDQVLSAFLEQGLYDLEFHPDYANNGRFFVHFAEMLRNGDGMIVEYARSAEDENRADPESARVILQIEQPWANHNGGELAFGPDGYLYIGSGDGGWEGDPLEAGQDLKTLLGKLLRIDVNAQDGRPYAIPADNPFASAQSPQLVQLFGITEEVFAQIHTEARPEIWAYGLRNPWKFNFDPETADLYLPDVGQNYWEEINFQPADSPGGENYGWDFMMGSHCFPIENEECGMVGVLPVAEYSHPEDSGCTVIGLGIYRGDEYPNLDGVYFSGDYCSGIIWGLMRDENNTWHYAQVLDTNFQLTGAGQDENGTIYVTTCHCNYGGPGAVDNPPGTLWRIVAADQVPEGAETAPTQ
ncbi:MAG: PQQ-dependent sugar dehydrogenase [Caldilineaceae bacterium]|nr:PQQ-dependent sugar dehydrogenase [Caldilineaceae bacterium]